MRLASVTIVLALVLAAGIAPAAAADSFDGKWIAEMPPQQAPCNTTETMTAVVIDGNVIGQILGRRATFNGKVEADGGGTISFGQDSGTIKFSGSQFAVNWMTPKCGQLHAFGDRAPSDADNARLANERRQHQARYAELVTQAEAGDQTIDYTQLRADYPYSEHWDPYGNKTDGLMQQAEAAVNGGDCRQAMTLLDQVIETDFTIDSAHALRSDCLKASDPARAAIESQIADGLVRSLMNSGNGDSEPTAYVVGTMWEERDILANRHIQLKTRQTRLRGGGGRYYDLASGVSLKDGVQAHKIYFDASALVAGRLSRDAAVAIATAALH